jgi:hypothetical protein
MYMSDVLDLDVLSPEPKKVKAGGKVYEIKPLRIKDFISLQKILQSTQNKTDNEKIALVGDLMDSIKAVVPDIEKMNLTMQQTMALIEFIYKQELVNHPQVTEKKTEELPTA